MRAVVERVTGTPTERLAALLAESERQGVACVRRLVQEWSSGDNRFDRPGEARARALEGQRVVVDRYSEARLLRDVDALYRELLESTGISPPAGGG